MGKTKRTLILVILSMMAGMVYLTPLLRFSFYDQMLQALQITDVQMGTIGAVYGAFNVATYILSGILAEKFRTKRLLLISAAGMTLITLWYSFFPGYAALLVIHALYGLFSVGIFWSPYLKAVRQLGSEEEQSRMFGISEALRGVTQTVVAFLCLGAMGLIASQTLGFRVLLLINAAVFALLFAAILIFIPDFDAAGMQKEGEAAQEKQPAAEKVSLIGMLKLPAVWICIFVIMCGYTLWNTANGYIGTYCTRVLQLPESLSSTLSIVRSYIIVFAAGFSGGVILDRFKNRGRGMMLMFLCGAVSAVGILVTEHLVFVCIFFTILLAYFANVIKSTYWSIMGDAGIPLAATGLATGIISLIGLTPDIFVSPIISRFISWGEQSGSVTSGFRLMLIWMVVWGVLGILASLILKKKKDAGKERTA